MAGFRRRRRVLARKSTPLSARRILKQMLKLHRRLTANAPSTVGDGYVIKTYSMNPVLMNELWRQVLRTSQC